jgi:hypothetical protein
VGIEMTYRISFSCDYARDYERCDSREYVNRPEPSSLFSQHLPEGWGMVRAGPPGTPYDVYCPHHMQKLGESSRF